MVPVILAVNAGSSSLKFKLFEADSLEPYLGGKVTGIGSAKAKFLVTEPDGREVLSKILKISSEPEAVEMLTNWIGDDEREFSVAGIGHRIVHGGEQFFEPENVTRSMLEKLKLVEKLAPLHLPDALSNLSIFLKAFPKVVQVASFDTQFHSAMPDYARLYALPAYIRKMGLRRYGFHGLSCQYIMHYLKENFGPVNRRKIIVAHLGSGSSLTAVADGKSVDTTMGFTPAGGIIMGSRSGDIDPGVVPFLLKQKGLSIGEIEEIFNKESGVLAISGKSGDVSKLLQRSTTHKAYAKAIDAFCYSVKKAIGQFAAVMNGLDELIFTGGVGENVAEIRQRICDQMDFLGIQIDPDLNFAREAGVISFQGSRVTVRVIATNEEYILAQNVKEFLI